MERSRTWSSFALATVLGVLASAALLFAGEFLLRTGWKDLDVSRATFAYFLIAFQGAMVGGLLVMLTGYYPSLEGFLASLTVVVRLLIRDDFQLGLDNFVELLLKFESHFACLYLVALVLFLARGGGLYYPLFIGLRYLRFKMITAISVAGVALGVAAMVVVLSVMSGFESDLKGKIIGTNAHAIVQKRGTDFTEYQLVLEKIRRVPGVIAVTPFVYNEVMVSSEYNLSGVFVKGIDPETAGTVTNLDDSVDEGSLELLLHPEGIDRYLEERRKKAWPYDVPTVTGTSAAPAATDKPAAAAAPASADGGAAPDADAAPTTADKPPAAAAVKEQELAAVPAPVPLDLSKVGRKRLPGIFIGKELKKILKVQVGDQVNIVAPLSEELGPSGPVPKARAFRVAGVFFTGMYEYDAKSVNVTLRSAQEFFGMGDSVTGVALKLDNPDRAGPVCESILAALDGYPYFTRTWFQMNKNLFTALKMEKIGMFILVVIVTLVSAFGIISTLIMLVWEKIKEIAILKSMGATPDGVMKIFMMEGILIGMVGTGLGLLLGWLVCNLLQSYGLQLDPEVYYIENLPVNMDAVEFVLIAGIALHISFIATIYPSARASRLRPVEGLRYD